MSVQQYRLSNRQQKELVIRGQELRLAIPAPAKRPPSLVDFARASLPELPTDVAVDAQLAMVSVAMPPFGEPVSTAGVIGAIVSDVAPADTIILQVSVVIAVLTPPRCRGAVAKTQWPGVILE